MLNIKVIIRTLGFLLIGEGILMLLTLLLAAFYQEGDVQAFAVSTGITIFTGTVSSLLTRKANPKIGKREGYIIVSFVWVLFSFFGSLPFILSNSIPALHDAFFETMSGFTTTGATILNNIESMPHGILFWRSLIQWIGGMGIVVLSLAILPAFGIGGMSLYAAEAPGVTYDKINPKIKDTAQILWNIYLLLTVAQTILLCLGGMGVYDSVCHSFTTMATGGFSTKQASIGYWDSAYIQYVIIFFMFLAGNNFTLSYFALKGSPKKMFENEEFRYYLCITLLVAVIIAIGLVITDSLGYEKAFRDALFQVVTIITTTGYATTDYLLWHPFLTYLLFLTFFIGGSTGSTGGGIKVMRIVLLVKNSYYELRRLIHPNAIIPLRFNHKTINSQIIHNTLAFFFLYMTIFIISSLVLMLFMPEFETAIGAVATSLGNIGPGLGSVGPAASFSHLPAFAKWFLSFLMLVGRLELFTVIIIFSPTFWKK
jgi:trk system potassium uptake protein TrkH